MHAGDVIADRFEIERLAGAGGMGRVYQAVDRAGGGRVALKVLQRCGAHEALRFAREARLLASLRHPAVVRYVAHGATREGDPYLVMDWLEGETLSARLRRQGLDVAESVALARRIAGALGALHKAGVVHRDVKPSNVLLEGGSIERPMLIDFGVARSGGTGTRLTAAGAWVGTPGFMAPEQARGEPEIDARADVFSLGCLLFKCLTGRDAFAGPDVLSVLLKIVVEHPPRPSEIRAGVPPDLDDLLASFLAKQRDRRPRDGDAAAAALDALDLAPRPPRASLHPAADAREITTNERKLLCLLLVRDAAADGSATYTAAGLLPPGGLAAADLDPARRGRAARAAASRHRGRVEALGDDALLVLFSGAGEPTELAVRAGRCALSIRAAAQAPVSLVTGRAEIADRLPIGELIDRAVRLLAPRPIDPEAPAPPRGEVRVDDLTTGLLGARFELRRADEGAELVRERDGSDPAQVLLGRPTACVGRDRELALLDAAVVHATEDSGAGAVLVTGPAGIGKSRLRHELIRRLRERGEPFELWIGHGDPMSAGSAFGLLARAVASALGVREGDPAPAIREAILARTASLPGAERVAAFLGELLSAPFDDDASPMRTAARRDPVLMGDQTRRAAEDLLRAACADRTVLLVLEDLQWGDLPTVTFVDAALRNLADLPLLVLALARPEVHAVFPRLWAGRAVQTLPLAELPRRAAERLVAQALGDAAPPARVKQIVERAGGNAFYLEELIRAVAAGRGADLPETVLAMTQARIDALDPDVRRVLRAASVFGRAFTAGGVQALLGGAPAERHLAALVEDEVLVQSGDAIRPEEAVYGFRHALMREAAYGMLTAADRAVGHELAGAWLEREGKGDAMALAEHFERGGDRARAAVWYARAAVLALEGDDLAAVIDRGGRARSSGAHGADLGAACVAEAEAHLWRGELARAEERAAEAASLLPPGSGAWLRALTHAVGAAGKQGAADRVDALIAAASAAAPAADALGAMVLCLSACATELAFSGRLAAAGALIAQAAAAAGDPPRVDPQALGYLHQARACRALGAGDPGASLGSFEAALEAFELAGDRRNACTARCNLGFLFVELGGFGRAEEVLRAALADAERMGIHESTATVLQNLGHALAHTGRLDEARRAEEQAVELLRGHGSARLLGGARTYLGLIALRAGDLPAAEREARAAAEILRVAPPLRAEAVAVLSRALLRQGRAADALAAAEEAHAVLDAAGGALEEGESIVRLVYAEALAAAGRPDDAARALAAAKGSLLARAARISDPAWRERFLTLVPDNAATLAAAAALDR